MKMQQSISIKYSKVIPAFLACAVIVLGYATNVSADPISPEIQAKVEQYKKKLTEWAANPLLIAIVKSSNAKGGLAPGMKNLGWADLNENDPVVTGFQTSEAGKYLKSLEADKGINKLYARDEKGNLVAGSSKPAFYNNAARAPFKSAIGGHSYADSETKTDPTTLKKSVQVSVPIMSDGKPIGVLHTAVNAD
jgi:hypothetical protein